jgi:hypothetical protein
MGSCSGGARWAALFPFPFVVEFASFVDTAPPCWSQTSNAWRCCAKKFEGRYTLIGETFDVPASLAA